MNTSAFFVRFVREDSLCEECGTACMEVRNVRSAALRAWILRKPSKRVKLRMTDRRLGREARLRMTG